MLNIYSARGKLCLDSMIDVLNITSVFS